MKAANEAPRERPAALDIDHEKPRERPRRGELHGADDPDGWRRGLFASIRLFGEAVRVVVLSEREHHLVCHMLHTMLGQGQAGPPTRDLLKRLEAARAAPQVRPTLGWLARWRASKVVP